MKTTRRNFLASIPILAALCGIKREPAFKVDTSGPIAIATPTFSTTWPNTYTWIGVASEPIAVGQMLTFCAAGKIKPARGEDRLMGFAITNSQPNQRVEVRLF